MATVDMTSGTATRLRADQYSNKVILVEKEIDFAAVTTSKGSALAANDVIQTIDLPAGSMILGAGFEVVTAMTGTSTDLALDLGITGVDVDAFVDGFDYDAAAVGDYSAVPAATIGYKYVVGTADTLDILIQAQTNTFTGGKLRVWALIVDLTGRDNPGLAGAGV